MPNYNLLVICECKITAEDERKAVKSLSNMIEDAVTDAGELKRLSVSVVSVGTTVTGGEEVSKGEEAALEQAGLRRADALAREILSGRGWER